MIAIIVSNVTLRFVNLLFKSNWVTSNIDNKKTPRMIAGKKAINIFGKGSRATLNLNLKPG